MAMNFIGGLTPFVIDKITTAIGWNNNDKNQILDPITTSVRICLLVYKPLYTKIGIDENRIWFHEPSIIPLYQGVVRTYTKDQKSDINIIMTSIEKLLIWYKISDKKIRYLCDGLINGFEKLGKCYSKGDSGNMIIKHIDYFIEKTKRELGEIHETSEDSNISDTDSILSDRLVENDVNYEFFKSHWNDRELTIIYNQLKELELDEDPEKRSSIINSIENFLSHKDKQTHKHIDSLTKYKN